jgi:hypothetical protein
MTRRDICILAALALAGAIMVGCGDEDTQAQLNQVSDFVQGVGTSDGLGVASLRTGDAPTESGGPGISESTESASVITGGSVSVPVSSSEGEFTAVIVSVEGASDYYEVSLSSPVQSTELVLTIGQDVPTEGFTARYALVDAEGLVGAYWGASLTVQAVGAESPDVQVTLSWDVDSDLDLWLTDGNGESINFANTSTSTGGTLDLDSNRGCTIDGVRNESISYPSGQAPNGNYLAQVMLSGDCGTESTKYILTILVAGESPQTHIGTISGEFIAEEHQYAFSFGEIGAEDCTGIPTLAEGELGASCDPVEGGCENGVCINNLCHQACDPVSCTSVCGANDCVAAASDAGTEEPDGPPRQVEAAGACELGGTVPMREINCADELDDDLDGATDCADSDCSADPACSTVRTETDCGNEIDDDDDGAIDCLDSDCSGDAACAGGIDCNMTGTWDGTVSVSEPLPFAGPFTADLTQEGSSLTGNISWGGLVNEVCGVSGTDASLTGTVEGNSISFGQVEAGIGADFSGTLETCDAAAGTFTVDGGECDGMGGDWTLTRGD